ncbi:MAG: hypothetical protein IJN29_05380 [Akkermansia sp.]|nr:hypothetical protein [Akkermansia sp.]
MTNKMSEDLKREIFSGLQDVRRRCETVMTHIANDRHKSVIWDALKWVKKDTDSLLKWAKAEYIKECYGIRKEQA